LNTVLPQSITECWRRMKIIVKPFKVWRLADLVCEKTVWKRKELAGDVVTRRIMQKTEYGNIADRATAKK
jgi:hypothetical protein